MTRVFYNLELNSIIVWDALSAYYEYLIVDAVDKDGILKPPCKRLVYSKVPETSILLGDL